MKSSKTLSVLVLVLLSLLLTTFTFAYWAEGITPPKDNKTAGTVQIGTGETVSTTINVVSTNGDKKLVPKDRVSNSNEEVESVTLKFDVKWNSEGKANGTKGRLSISKPEYSFADESNSDVVPKLFNHTITANGNNVNATGLEITADAGNPIEVTLTIKMEEPKNIEEYEIIAGQLVKATLDFKIELDK